MALLDGFMTFVDTNFLSALSPSVFSLRTATDAEFRLLVLWNKDINMAFSAQPCFISFFACIGGTSPS
jgi:hypothetical protein